MHITKLCDKVCTVCLLLFQSKTVMLNFTASASVEHFKGHIYGLQIWLLLFFDKCVWYNLSVILAPLFWQSMQCHTGSHQGF